MVEKSMALSLDNYKDAALKKALTNLSRPEKIIVMSGFFGLGILLALVAGGPIYSDELWYLQLGLNNVKDPFYLNRYTHVFLQKIFIELAPSVIGGAKIYWSFLISLTGLLVYLGPRVLSKHNHILHSLLAIGLYFSFPFYIEYSGVTVIDFTAMLMVALIVMVFMISVHYQNDHKGILILLGFLLFLAFKTKESTMAAGIVLLGLGFKDGAVFDFSLFKWGLLKVLVGVIAGLVFFIVLSGIILKDPWFGLTAESLQGFYATYIETGKFLVLPANWYIDYIFPVLPLAFLLYLISGIQADDRITPALRLVWLVPLALVVGLVLTMLKSNWGVFPRYFFPALPVLAMLAPQFLKFKQPEGDKVKLHVLFGAVIVVLLIGIIFGGGLLHARMVGFNYGSTLHSIVYPISLSVLLGTVLLVNRYTALTALIPLSAILSMIIHPIGKNFHSVVIERPNQRRVQERFYPFSSFDQEIQFSNEMDMYVSLEIPASMGMLSTDKNELMSMFNIHFRTNATKTAFTYSSSTGTIPDDLRQVQYDYVLLTSDEWRQLSSREDRQHLFEKDYTIFQDGNQRLVLLRWNGYEGVREYHTPGY
jgi:hypothetical protein